MPIAAACCGTGAVHAIRTEVIINVIAIITGFALLQGRITAYRSREPCTCCITSIRCAIEGNTIITHFCAAIRVPQEPITTECTDTLTAKAIRAGVAVSPVSIIAGFVAVLNGITTGCTFTVCATGIGISI